MRVKVILDEFHAFDAGKLVKNIYLMLVPYPKFSEDYTRPSWPNNNVKKCDPYSPEHFLDRGDTQVLSTGVDTNEIHSRSVWQSDWISDTEDSRREDTEKRKKKLAKHRSKNTTRHKKDTDRLRSSEGTFRVHKVYGDGNCMFRSVSYIIWGDENEHRGLRTMVVEHIKDNWHEYGPFVLAEWSISHRQEYYNYMNADGVYATELECLVATKLYHMNLSIYREYDNHGTIKRIFHNRINNGYETARLLFSGRTDSGHYDALLPD